MLARDERRTTDEEDELFEHPARGSSSEAQLEGKIRCLQFLRAYNVWMLGMGSRRGRRMCARKT